MGETAPTRTRTLRQKALTPFCTSNISAPRNRIERITPASMKVGRLFCYIAVPLLLLAAGACRKESKSGSDFDLKIDAKSNIFAVGSGGLDANGGGKAAPSVSFEPRAGLLLTFSN